MLLMTCKRIRNRLTGRFSYVVKNCVKYRRMRKDYVLKISSAILRAGEWRVGDELSFSVRGRAVVIARKCVRRGQKQEANGLRVIAKRKVRNSLIGTVLKYDCPMDPVTEWQ